MNKIVEELSRIGDRLKIVNNDLNVFKAREVASVGDRGSGLEHDLDSITHKIVVL